ncbi:UNVERIFIED_CONTAM: hypothetical protein Slati_1793300 [Sesamum latifolium]|uniref:Uncharacterized protein n=1 Tax=Sesamum latifolium TaxID=2727402 RepID=A0AAW2X0A2_9LAMI
MRKISGQVLSTKPVSTRFVQQSSFPACALLTNGSSSAVSPCTCSALPSLPQSLSSVPQQSARLVLTSRISPDRKRVKTLMWEK